MKAKFNIFISIVMGFFLLTGSIEASTKNEHARFSIAISGGASKGAYEAGLNWGAIKIVREAPEPGKPDRWSAFPL
jgi:hypothetical protein